MHTWKMEVQLHSFLNLALDVGGWATSCLIHSPAREETSITDGIEGWMGPRESLDVLEEREISCNCWDLNPGCSSL
jgi:hypothetical protein